MLSSQSACIGRPRVAWMLCLVALDTAHNLASFCSIQHRALRFGTVQSAWHKASAITKSCLAGCPLPVTKRWSRIWPALAVPMAANVISSASVHRPAAALGQPLFSSNAHQLRGSCHVCCSFGMVGVRVERHASPRQRSDCWTANCRCHGRKQMDVENECGNCSGGTCMCQTPENCKLSASPAVLSSRPNTTWPAPNSFALQHLS